MKSVICGLSVMLVLIGCATPQSSVRPPTASGYPVAIGQSFHDCEDGCPEMVLIPPGNFTMGMNDDSAVYNPSKPIHSVVVPSALAVGKYHVTHREYARFVAATGHSSDGACLVTFGQELIQSPLASWSNPEFPQTDQDPVVCVNWDDAQAYVRWLGQKTGKAYRLLTEAEWEYAARGGTSSDYFWGNDEADQCFYANGGDNTLYPKPWPLVQCTDGYAYTSPVGSFRANGFGLYDMAGNAWQWVEDCWTDNYDKASNDTSVPAVSGGYCRQRVARGGSWINSPSALRAGHRAGSPPGFSTDTGGFRVARTPG